MMKQIIFFVLGIVWYDDEWWWNLIAKINNKRRKRNNMTPLNIIYTMSIYKYITHSCTTHRSSYILYRRILIVTRNEILYFLTTYDYKYPFCFGVTTNNTQFFLYIIIIILTYYNKKYSILSPPPQKFREIVIIYAMMMFLLM